METAVKAVDWFSRKHVLRRSSNTAVSSSVSPGTFLQTPGALSKFNYSIRMVEQFIGTWKMTSSDNFDEYMKAIGMGFATRQIGNMAKPNLLFSVDDAGLISMKAQGTFKTLEIKFKLNEEFDETTADDRKTKTIFTYDNGKLLQKQSWDGKTTTVEREIADGKLIAKCFMDDVVAVRTYEKHA